MQINPNKLFNVKGKDAPKTSRPRLLISDKLLIAMVDAGRAITTQQLRHALSQLSGIEASSAAIQNHISIMMKNGHIVRLEEGAKYEPTDEGHAYVKQLKKSKAV